MTPTGLVWDACTTLNLMATDRATEILTVFGRPSYIVKEVREGEVFSLRALHVNEDDPASNLVPIDLMPLIIAGVLHEVEMTPAEQATFVKFAAEVDDGEARSLAVAVHRRLTLVSDDKKSIRLAKGLEPPVAVITTIDWVKWWVEEREVDDDILGTVLHRIEVCAHYRPRRTHPLKLWWENHLP